MQASNATKVALETKADERIPRLPDKGGILLDLDAIARQELLKNCEHKETVVALPGLPQRT